MPLGPTQVVEYNQPTAIGALAKYMGGIQAQRDNDQEAQDKIAQQEALRKHQLALSLISKMSVDQAKQFLEDNPNVADFVLRPDNSADAAKDKALTRLLTTPSAQLSTTERLMAAHVLVGGGASMQRAIAAGVAGGDQSATNAVNIETGQAQSVDQQVNAAERARHNVTGEKQLAPVRQAETFRNTQQGNASRESATNQAQRRDINSPLTQTEIGKTKVGIEMRAAAKPSATPNYADPSASDFEEHPAIKPYNDELRRLDIQQRDLLSGATRGAGNKPMAPRELEARRKALGKQINDLMARRLKTSRNLGVPVTAADAATRKARPPSSSADDSQRDLSLYSPTARASITRGLADGSVHFEPSPTGGEYISGTPSTSSPRPQAPPSPRGASPRIGDQKTINGHTVKWNGTDWEIIDGPHAAMNVSPELQDLQDGTSENDNSYNSDGSEG